MPRLCLVFICVMVIPLPIIHLTTLERSMSNLHNFNKDTEVIIFVHREVFGGIESNIGKTLSSF